MGSLPPLGFPYGTLTLRGSGLGPMCDLNPTVHVFRMHEVQRCRTKLDKMQLACSIRVEDGVHMWMSVFTCVLCL